MTAETVVDPLVVIAPGVYDDMPIETYFADPVAGGSLSCSGAKKLLPPSCPALYKWERDNPPESTKTFDTGHAAHQRVLRVGPEIVVIPGDRWDTIKAKAQVKEAREAGQVPVKADVMEMVDAMAAAIRAHPIASVLLGDGGHPESSLFWRDERSDVMLRSRVDWRPAPKTGRTIGVDYKTCQSAYPDEFAKAAARYGYDIQAAWYLDGLRALDLADDDAQFVFIAQEKTPPYVVQPVQLDVVAMRIGRHRKREAIDLYAKCTERDEWPGYSDDVAHVSLPYFYERQFEDVL